MIIGRIDEIKKLNKSYSTNKSELVSIYGRRRVGKTFLVKETFNNLFDFTFTGIYKLSKQLQIERFKNAIEKKINKQLPKITSWFSAFDYLKEYLLSLNKDKVLVFIDELPWMDSKNSNFIKAFENFWNNWDYDNENHTLIKLYICGSATTWMINEVLNNKGGLYGRITDSIYLTPFTLYESKEYFNKIKNVNFSEQEVLQYYMVLGGIPYYFDKIDTSLPYTVNIDNLFFKSNSTLTLEFDLLYESLFTNSSNYLSVIEALSNKLIGLTRDEISKITKLQGSNLTEILENLTNCSFIRKYNNSFKKTKEMIYQLTDLFSLFYLKFVKYNTNNYNYWSLNFGSPKINNWFGYAYEMVVLHHIKEITNALSISGISHKVYSWKVLPWIDKNNQNHQGNQIDLIIDRNDGIMNIIEIKYSNEPYKLTKEYLNLVKERIINFKDHTKTNKNLKITFVTNIGLFENDYLREVDYSITTHDLFKE